MKPCVSKLFFGLILVPSLTSAAPQTVSTERREFTHEAVLSYGIPAKITAIGTEADADRLQATLQRAESIMRDLDQQLGEDEGSAISKINALPARTFLPLSPSLFSILEQSIHLSLATGGWFDVTAPSPKSSFTSRDYRRIILDPPSSAIAFKSNRMQLDAPLLLKAGAVDQAFASLRADGIADVEVAVGEVTRRAGRDVHGPWYLEVQAPSHQQGGYAHRVYHYAMTDVAFAHLSAKAIGNRLIDAKSKKPIEPQIASVTTIAKDAMTALAYAVALYSFEPLTAIRYLQKFPQIYGVIVDPAGQVFLSEGMQKIPRARVTDESAAPAEERGPKDIKLKEQEEQEEQ